MRKKIYAAAAVLLFLAAAAALVRLRYAMPAAEVVRKLSGLRVALTLYRLEHKTFPASFGDIIADGKLETVPEIKLSWHRGKTKVLNVGTLKIRDTGTWAYVNDPASEQFGLVYIDCRHNDEKGRFWSEF